MSLFSIGFSPGTLTSEDMQSIEDREWEENFEEKFADDPEAGFSRDPQRAWGTIVQDPEILTRSPNMAQLAASNNPGAFVNVVQDNQDLLSDTNVRVAYESLIVTQPLYAQAYPDTFNRFLLEEGIEESSFGLENGEIELVSYTMLGTHRFIEFRQREGDNIIVASIESLQGSRITPNGEVVYPNGVSVVHGEIGRIPGSNEIYVSQIEDSSQPVQARLNGVDFSSSEFYVGLGSQGVNPYIRAMDAPVEFEDALRRNSRLMPTSRLSIDEGGNLGLNGELRVGRMIEENGVQVYVPQRVFTTGFSSNQEEMRICTNSLGCEGSQNFIIDQGEVLQINVANQEEFRVGLYGNEDLAVRINHISDESSVLLTRMSEEARVDFRIDREDTQKIGFFGENSGLSLLTFHEEGHRGVDSQIYGHVFNAQNPDGIRLHQIQLEEGIDLSIFPENIRGAIQNADFTSIPNNQNSIVVALNNLGLPSDMDFRRQLAEQLGIEGYRGTASQNMELLNRLRGGEFTASRAVNVGFQNPEIFELNPNLQPIVVSSEDLNPFNCEIGEECSVRNAQGRGSTYTRIAEDIYCHADGTCFDRFGRGVDRNSGELNGRTSSFYGRGIWVSEDSGTLSTTDIEFLGEISYTGSTRIQSWESCTRCTTVQVPTGEPPLNAPEAQRQAFALNYFMSQGWTREQAAGIVGNLMQESYTRMDHTAVNSIGATGIAQWLGVRRENFQRITGTPLRSASFSQQLAYVQWELENVERHAANDLRRQTTVEGASVSFRRRYERPGEHEAHDSRRIMYARQVYSLN